MNARRRYVSSGTIGWVLFGAVTGLVAGAAFILFEMVSAKYAGRPAAAPLRLIAAIALGREALPGAPKVGIGTVLTAGFIIHFGLSMVFGAVFGAIVSMVRPLQSNRIVLVGAAALYGLLLWLINFYIAGNLFFPWFTNANPFLQFVAHGFFFGTLLGLLLGGALQEGEEGARVLALGRLAMWSGIVMLGATGVIHLVTAPHHFKEFAFYVGVLFVANIGGALVAAAGIIRNSALWAWLFGFAVAGGAFVSFLISRTVGLPFTGGPHIGEWAGAFGILSLIVEFLFVVAFLVAAITRTVGIRELSDSTAQDRRS